LQQKGLTKIAPCIYSNIKTKTIYMPWATDLLPHEIDAIKKQVPLFKKEKKCQWVGTIGYGLYGNKPELDGYIRGCDQYWIPFYNSDPWLKGIDLQEHIRLIQSAYMAPAIVGRWQKENGYIPCRLFKNISYGQMGITNSYRAYLLFGKKVIYHPHTYQLFFKAHQHLEKMQPQELYVLMDFVKKKHTFINRIKVLLRFMREVERQKYIPYSSAIPAEPKMPEPLNGVTEASPG